MFNFRKLLLALSAALLLPMASQAKEVQDFYADYSTFTEFPYYKMGYAPTYEDGVMKTISPGGWYQHFIADGFTLDPSYRYTITVKVKGSEAGSCNLNIGTWGSAIDRTLSFGTEWEEKTINFIDFGPEGTCHITMQGTYGGTIEWAWLKVTHDDTPLNPADKCLVLDNITPTDNAWDTEITFTPAEILPAGAYTLALDIKGANPGKFQVRGTHGDGNAWYGDWGGEVAFTDEWTALARTYEFKTGIKTISIAFGGSSLYDGPTVYIDNMALYRVGDPEHKNYLENADFTDASNTVWTKPGWRPFTMTIDYGPANPIDQSTKNPFAVWRGLNEQKEWSNALFIKTQIFENLQYGDRLLVKYDTSEYEGSSLQFVLGGWGKPGLATYSGHSFITRYSEESIVGIEMVPALETYLDNENTHDCMQYARDGGVILHGDIITREVIFHPVNHININNSAIYNNINSSNVAAEVRLADGIAYSNSIDETTANKLTYSREFASAEWQALFVPFDLDYSVWSEYGEVATLDNIEKDGDAYVLNWEPVTSGKLTPNKPYIFRPADAGKVDFVCTNATLAAANNVPAEYTFTAADGAKVTLHGTYATKTDMGDGKTYALSHGAFYRTLDNSKTLKPFRFFLTMEAAPAGPSNMPMKLACRVNDELQGVEDLLNDNAEDNGEIYDLMGRRVENPAPGIYVRNGKTIIVK